MNHGSTLRGGVRRLPQLIFYKPLATLLAILMAPAFSWIGSDGAQRGSSAFQAHAQTASGCGSGTNTLIQNYCGTSTTFSGYNLYHNDLVQLETDSIDAYLGAHNLPASDSTVIYGYGRADLRDSIRAYMMATLLGIISKPASSRSAHEETLYSWLQLLVQQNEIALYTAAYNNYLLWQSDPCKFALESTLATAYNISYNGAPFCGNGLNQVFTGPPVPAPSYFLAYGLEQGYEQWGKQCPITNSCGQLPILPDMTAKLDTIVGLTVDAEGVLAGALGSLLYTNLAAAQAAFLAGFQQVPAVSNAGNAIGESSYFTDGAVVDEIGLATTVLVPVTIVLVAAAIGVDVGFQTFNNQNMLDQLNDLQNQLTAAQNTLPDLNAFASDSTGLGLLKLENTLITQTLRTNLDGTMTDQPATATLPVHQTGTDLNFQHQSGQTSPTLSYVGWNGENWTAQTWGGWFVQTCAKGPQLDTQMTGTCGQTDSISADLDFIDWSFWESYEAGGNEQARFTASRFHDVDYLGNTREKFSISRTGGPLVDGKTSISTTAGTLNLENCPAGAGGVSPGPYTSNSTVCWGYVSNQIPIVLANLTAATGAFDLINLVDGVLPAFSGPTNITFDVGVASSQTVSVAGTPAPTGCVSSTNLPNSFTVGGKSIGYLQQFGCNYQDLGSNFQVSFNGATLLPGTYSLTVQFSSSVGTTTQTYTINVASTLGIVSAGTMSVTPGVPTSFTVVATGSPTPKLTVDPLFAPYLNGLTFNDNGNGTATINGTYASLLAGACTHVTPGPSGANCGIIATTYNSNHTIKAQVEQQFGINVVPAAAATLASHGATWTTGVANQTQLSATGAVTPISWCFGNGQTNEPYPLPCTSTPPFSWLTLTDNGNGTATLSGTPPVGTSGKIGLNIVPAAQYSYASSGKYILNMTNAPVFANPGSTTFTVGSSGSFTVSSTEGAISLANSLAAGLLFSSSGNSGTISGTPAAGTGGQYGLLLTAADGALGSATQNLVLNINEMPFITSPPVATFFVGVPGSFDVTTTGYPSTSNQPFSASQPLATLAAMHFQGTGLPASLSTSNLNAEGFLTGTLDISGKPLSTDAGTYTYSLQVNNGIGVAYQDLSVRVLPFTPTAPVTLLPQVGLSLDRNKNIVLSVVLSNGGSSTAENVQVTSAKFTSTGGSVTPTAINPATSVSIPSATSATFNLVCPNTIGFTGSNVATYTISVSYSGGTLTFSGRTLII